MAAAPNPSPPFHGGDPASVDFYVYEPVEQGMARFRGQVCAAVRNKSAPDPRLTISAVPGFLGCLRAVLR
jgi:hypothetical protein